MSRVLVVLMFAWLVAPAAGHAQSPAAAALADLAGSDAARREAAVKLGNQADAGAVPVVEEALQKEPNRWVRQALAEALAMIRLAHGDGSVRAAAATTLGTLHAQNALPALRRLAADTGAGAPERA